MKHFLLIYSHKEGRLVDQSVFNKSEVDEATAAYRSAESQHGADDGIEIVLIGSDSIDTVHRTHGHYFAANDSVERYLALAEG